MSLGAFAPLPIRLGGSQTEGWSAQAHARMCADLVAVKRVAPVAIFTFFQVGSAITITYYVGQNGAGLAYAPDEVFSLGTGYVHFRWSTGFFTDPYGIQHPLNLKGAKATIYGAASARALWSIAPNGVDVKTVDAGGAAFDAQATVRLF